MNKIKYKGVSIFSFFCNRNISPEPTLIFLLTVIIFFEYLQILNMITTTKCTSFKTAKLIFHLVSRSNCCINDLSTFDFSKC